MRWEELTAIEFEKAVKRTKTCILPMGIIERHGSHSPLGTDMINVIGVCNRAAEIEPFVVSLLFTSGRSMRQNASGAPLLCRPKCLLIF